MVFVNSSIYMPSYERFTYIVCHELQALLFLTPDMTSSGFTLLYGRFYLIAFLISRG